MTKRITAIIFALVLVLSAALIPAAAAEEYGYALDDAADLLTADEEAALSATIRDVSAKCKCNLAVVTADDLYGATFSHSGTAQDYADEYYDNMFGKGTDGIVIFEVLSNQNGKRALTISTSGKCIKRLSDDERDAIFDDAQYNHNPDSAGYYDMLNAVTLDLQKYVPPHLEWYKLPMAFGIGFVIALIIMMILRGQLKSVKMERGAVNYIRPGSMNVTAARDTYLYSTVSRTARPKDDGGSSSHTSSGGGTHGGGSREF